MSVSEGTLPTGTEIQNTVDAKAYALAQQDKKLEDAVLRCAKAADTAAGKLAGKLVDLAHAVDALYTANSWTRLVNVETGKPFTSAKAYFGSLFKAEKFPNLNTTVRRDLVGMLMDPETGQLTVGSNELAALTGVNQGTISRDRDAKAAEAEAAKIAEAKAAEARAEAEAKLAETRAEAEAAEAAKAEAEAKVAAATKAAGVFSKAVETVDAHYHLMSAEDAANTFALAKALVRRLTATNKTIAEGEAAERGRVDALKAEAPVSEVVPEAPVAEARGPRVKSA